MKKIVGIIPSRYESSRFPGKPLIDIKGKSMIQRVYNQAKKAKALSDVIVATDDRRIFEHVTEFGGKVVMTSSDHPSGTDRCFEVLQKSGDDFDIAVNIQGDEPMIKPEQIDLLVSCFEDNEVKIATLVKPFENLSEIGNPNRIKVVLDKNKNALYFSRSAIPFHQKGDTPKYYKHIGIYAYTSEILNEIVQLVPSVLEKTESLEQLRWLENGYRIQTKETEFETPNIDTPEDLNKVLALL